MVLVWVLHRFFCSNSSDIMIELCILPRFFVMNRLNRRDVIMVLATCLGLRNLAYSLHVEGPVNQNPVFKHFLGVHVIFLRVLQHLFVILLAIP